MASDGSLTFNTKLDVNGFNKGVKQISSKMIDLKNKVSQTEREIASLTKELKEMADTPIKSNASEKLEKDIAKTKSQLRAFYEEADKIGNSKQTDLESMGLGTDYLDDILSKDTSWQKVQKDIDKTEAALRRYEQELKQVREAEASITGKDTDEYAQKREKLQRLSENLNVYKAKIKETEQSEKKSGKETNKVSKIFSRFKSVVSKAGKGLAGAFKNGAVNLIKKIGSHAKKSSSQVGVLSKSFDRIKQALSGMLIYQGISKIFEAAKQGMQNLAQASSPTNQSLSMLMSSLTKLKNSFATAFAPILNVVAPILTTFINLLSTVADKVAQFMTAITGGSTYTKAVDVQQDYAKSISNTTKATEENTEAAEDNQKNIAGYDELNVMQSDNNQKENNSSDITDLTPSDMFTTAAVNSSISGFAEQLKSLFDKQDFSGLGSLITNKINNALGKIDWKKIRSTAVSWAKNLANFFNGAVSGLNWSLVGSTFGNGLMTLFDFAYNFLTTFKFEKLGAGIADALNGLFASMNWTTVGGTFGGALQSIIALGFGFVTTLDWVSLGLSISDLIDGFFAEIDWSMAGQFISNGVIGLITTLKTTIANTDWKQIGEDIGSFFANIDWWGIFLGLLDLIKNCVNGIFDLFIGFLSGFGLTDWFKENLGIDIEKIIEYIKQTFGGFIDFISGVFSGDWEKAWQGICDFFTGIFDNMWYQTNLVIGWICNLILNVGNWIWENLILPVIGFFETLWTSVCEIFQNISDFIKGIWEGIWNAVKGFINKIIDGINDLWTGIYTAVKGIVDGIGGIAGAIGDIFGQDWHFSMPAEPPLIPKLATGTVVPANYGEFLAVLGDNKREAEVVSPISAMKQAMSEVLAEFGGAGGGDISLTINLDGEPIYRDVVRRNEQQRKRTGRSALA